MASSTTELIKEKLDIIDFLRGYLNLRPAGKNWKALCPFHREKTPSFMVSPERQSWHCFGCGAGGDIFGFLMRYENLEFGEALRILAERAGVELRRLSPNEYKYTGLLFDLNNVAKEFFRNALENCEPAKKYLAERKLKPETIEEFELGFAPNEPEALVRHLLNSGCAPDDVIRAGLILKNDRGLLYDRFRGRIIFPIHGHFGKVVGFAGRILPQFDTGELGKYVNSPETPIFNKSRTLYGLWKSRNFIRDAKAVFLVEGQMDFLMSWQAGVKNVVASSGTALTDDHLKALRRLTDEIYLSFDADEAGAAAAERAIDLAEASDFGVKVVSFSKFKDPAEAAEVGAGELTTAMASAVEAPIFYFDRYLPRVAGSDFHERKALKNLRLVLAKIKNISSPVARSFWINELGKRAGISEKILIEEAEKLQPVSDRTRAVEEESKAPARILTRRELVGERLLQAAAADGNYGMIDDCVDYLPTNIREALVILKSGAKSSPNPQIDEFLDLIILGSTKLGGSEVENLKGELIKEHIKERKQELTLAVKKAEEAHDENGLEAALNELRNLTSTVSES